MQTYADDGALAYEKSATTVRHAYCEPAALYVVAEHRSSCMRNNTYFAVAQRTRHNRLMTSALSTRDLQDQVEALLPDWQGWYPSLFDAACDLGILRARVCDLSSLVLSRRHASIYNEAVQSFRQQWSVEEPEESAADDSDTRRVQADSVAGSDSAD